MIYLWRGDRTVGRCRGVNGQATAARMYSATYKAQRPVGCIKWRAPDVSIHRIYRWMKYLYFVTDS